MEAIQTNSEMPIWVLLSGGIDSTASLAFYLKRHRQVRSVFIDYGQAAAEQEDSASKAVADHFGVERLRLRLVGAQPKSAGMIRGRNAFLLTTAFMEVGNRACLVAIGVHSGTSYSDCSEGFLNSMQTLFDSYVGGAVRVSAPFLHWTKTEIWDFCRDAKVPLELTYSCEAGGETPCGICLSCRDLEALNAL